MIKGKKIIISGSIFVLGAVFFLVMTSSSPARKKSVQVSINGKNFNAEVVDNAQAREKGLGGRNSLCEDCGMLFVFEKKGDYPFWMKGMEFPIDVIWIDGQDIVYVASQVQPASKTAIKPSVLADKVLEINAGQAERMNIKTGDKVEIK